VLPDATNPPAIATCHAKEIPEVVNVTRVFPTGQQFLISYEDKKITEEKLIRCDSIFLMYLTFLLSTQFERSI